ncbi:mannose-1-phosphate guanylyltransferase, partial [bacterium]|nr:mannose-1-phosphate guanylyltransferase [bacterium]
MTQASLNVTPVILCGGSGTRLWPLSRTGFPKQFLVLSGNTSLFQQAVSRLATLKSDLVKLGDTLVVTNEEHRFLVLDQLREMPSISATLLLEPLVRNTAPALTLAALQAISNGDDPILVVTPADQTVKNISAFTDALNSSIQVAASGAIVILGVAPDKPETGFGQYADYRVAQFAEKPDLERALAYLESGDYTWNSGMFVVRASIWLEALQLFRPDIMQATTNAFANRTQDEKFVRPDPVLFEQIPSESVDFAVIERCPESSFPIKVVALDAGWNDLGAWDAVWQV